MSDSRKSPNDETQPTPDPEGPQQEGVSEASLYAALAPERPDPDGFLREIAGKILRAEGAHRHPLDLGPPETIDLHPKRFGPFASAASLIPPGIFFTATKGTAAPATALGIKTLPSLLALPALTLLGFGTLLFGGIRALRGLDGSKSEEESSHRNPLRWHALASMGFIILAGTLSLAGLQDAMTWILAGSMVTVVLLLRSLSRAGLANRGLVAMACSRFLVLLWAYGLPKTLRLESSGYPGVPRPILYSVLFLTCLVCSLVAVRSKVRGAILSVWIHAGLASVFLAASFVAHPPSDEDFEEWAKNFQAPANETRDWELYSSIRKRLQEKGRPIDSAGARKAWDQRLGELRPSLPALRAALQWGFLRPDEEASFRRRAESLETGSERSIQPLRDAVPIGIQLKRGTLSPSDREAIVENILTLWKKGDFSLEETLVAGDLLETLGFSERLGEVSSVVEETLTSRWQGRNKDAPFGTAFMRGGSWNERGILRFAREHSTFLGVELMARHGAPESIDLDRIAYYLEVMARPDFWGFREQSYDVEKLLAGFALSRLEESFDITGLWPRRSLFEDRGFLGVILLCVLCGVATFQAPPSEGRR